MKSDEISRDWINNKHWNYTIIIWCHKEVQLIRVFKNKPKTNIAYFNWKSPLKKSQSCRVKQREAKEQVRPRILRKNDDETLMIYYEKSKLELQWMCAVNKRCQFQRCCHNWWVQLSVNFNRIGTSSQKVGKTLLESFLSVSHQLVKWFECGSSRSDVNKWLGLNRCSSSVERRWPKSINNLINLFRLHKM